MLPGQRGKRRRAKIALLNSLEFLFLVFVRPLLYPDRPASLSVACVVSRVFHCEAHPGVSAFVHDSSAVSSTDLVVVVLVVAVVLAVVVVDPDYVEFLVL